MKTCRTLRREVGPRQNYTLPIEGSMPPAVAEVTYDRPLLPGEGAPGCLVEDVLIASASEKVTFGTTSIGGCETCGLVGTCVLREKR